MPKAFPILVWKCEYCSETFSDYTNCKIHEKLQHKCRTCEHCYLVYGCEEECELKKCQYKEKAVTN